MPKEIRYTLFEHYESFSNISESTNNLFSLTELFHYSGSENCTSRAARYEHNEDCMNHTFELENTYLPLALEHKFKLEGPLLEETLPLSRNAPDASHIWL